MTILVSLAAWVRVPAGDTSIKGPRMSFTFETMFNQDEEFREAVLLVGGWGEGEG
jgi:hypothetical protein